jgi:hypothetical protein
VPSTFGTRTVAENDARTGRITVNADSRAYEDAQRGRPIELAGALVHEQWHLDHGPAEAGAYDAQLSVLRRLGAPRSVIADVQKALSTVTGQRQHAERVRWDDVADARGRLEKRRLADEYDRNHRQQRLELRQRYLRAVARAARLTGSCVRQ